MKSVFGGSSTPSTTAGTFSFGSSATVSTGFNFAASSPDTSGAGGERSSADQGSSLLAKMLMSGKCKESRKISRFCVVF